MVKQLESTQLHNVYKSVKNKKWTQVTIDHNLSTFIKNKTGLDHALVEALARRNIHPDSVATFLDPKLKHCMPNPNILQGMEQAVAITLDALREKKKITVFGDYDVDGATSVALLGRILKLLGHDNLDTYIPHRITEGYGLSIDAVRYLKTLNTDLIIAADCGSTSINALFEANKLGIQTVVLDHHICSEKLLIDSAVIINPNYVEDSSGLGYLAAVGVCFMFVVALLNKLSENNFLLEKKLPNPMLFLDLVALGTVCDVVPLKGLNRVLVKHGLKLIEARHNPGIKSLLALSSINLDTTIDTYHLGFILGPKINAGGRVGQEANLGLKLLLSDDFVACQTIAIKLGLHNHERRMLENQVLDEALSCAVIARDIPVVCVCGENWHQGIIGIVAERLKEKLGKPSIVITHVENGICKASCRSIKGIDIGNAILQAKQAGLLLAGGGHEMAAGFTIQKENIESLSIFLTEKFQSKFKEITANAINYYDSTISVESITVKFAKELNKMGPFGNGNEMPLFLLTNASIVHAKILKGEHVSCVIKDFSNTLSHKTVKGMCFRGIQSPIGELLLSKRANMYLIVSINLNKWQGQESAELVIHDAILPIL